MSDTVKKIMELNFKIKNKFQIHSLYFLTFFEKFLTILAKYFSLSM